MEGRELLTDEFNQHIKEWYEGEADKIEKEYDIQTPPDGDTNTTDDLPF